MFIMKKTKKFGFQMAFETPKHLLAEKWKVLDRSIMEQVRFSSPHRIWTVETSPISECSVFKP